MENAGANYQDEALVVDNNLMTSRRPGDLPIFTAAILNRLGLTIKGMNAPDVNDKTRSGGNSARNGADRQKRNR
jgi:protease I